MIVITGSGTLTSGTPQTVRFTQLQGGYKVLQLIVSTTNTTLVKATGVDNLLLQSIDETSGELREGFELGGDFQLKLSDLVQFTGQNVLEINGVPSFTFSQTTGADVEYAILLVVNES